MSLQKKPVCVSIRSFLRLSVSQSVCNACIAKAKHCHRRWSPSSSLSQPMRSTPCFQILRRHSNEREISSEV